MTKQVEFVEGKLVQWKSLLGANPYTWADFQASFLSALLRSKHTEVMSQLTPTAPTPKSEAGNQNLCTSRECSSQSNCCQQLNVSNSEMISPTVIDTINRSTTLDSNFMYDCDIEVKSDSTGHILGVGQINCKFDLASLYIH